MVRKIVWEKGRDYYRFYEFSTGVCFVIRDL